MLRPEVQQWEVQWEELEILRPIGRGSYGAVYAALWSQTVVAVKVLLIRGARAGHGRWRTCPLSCCLGAAAMPRGAAPTS